MAASIAAIDAATLPNSVRVPVVYAALGQALDQSLRMKTSGSRTARLCATGVSAVQRIKREMAA